MALGSTQGVTDLCDSSDTALIGRQLIVANAQLTTALSKKGLTVPATDTLLAHAVDLLAASIIASKPGAVDPRTNYKVDGFSRHDTKQTSQPDEYADAAHAIIADYIAATKVGTSPIPSMAIVGRRGRRIGEYELMTEAEEDDY
ncbi:MAG: hypothetical protein U9R21_03720 [Candidatus Thermoplasmatota archaeon]|nr:hypothetical protein [Candidatus Thermoplasmatota archaeon]